MSAFVCGTRGCCHSIACVCACGCTHAWRRWGASHLLRRYCSHHSLLSLVQPLLCCCCCCCCILWSLGCSSSPAGTASRPPGTLPMRNPCSLPPSRMALPRLWAHMKRTRSWGHHGGFSTRARLPAEPQPPCRSESCIRPHTATLSPPLSDSHHATLPAACLEHSKCSKPVALDCPPPGGSPCTATSSADNHGNHCHSCHCHCNHCHSCHCHCNHCHCGTHSCHPSETRHVTAVHLDIVLAALPASLHSRLSLVLSALQALLVEYLHWHPRCVNSHSASRPRVDDVPLSSLPSLPPHCSSHSFVVSVSARARARVIASLLLPRLLATDSTDAVSTPCLLVCSSHFCLSGRTPMRHGSCSSCPPATVSAPLLRLPPYYTSPADVAAAHGSYSGRPRW